MIYNVSSMDRNSHRALDQVGAGTASTRGLPPSGCLVLSLGVYLFLDGYDDLRFRASLPAVYCSQGRVDDDDVGDLDSSISNSLGHLRTRLVGLGNNPFLADQGFDHYRCRCRRGPPSLSIPDA